MDCLARQNNWKVSAMNNWETEFEVKYTLLIGDDPSHERTKSETLIIEAGSKSEVVNLIKHRFQYSEYLRIEEINELWKY